MRKLKKISLLFLLSMMILLSTSCNIVSNVIDAFDRKDRNKIAQDIVDCFNNDDVESLKNMFCDYVNDRHDLDAEISNAFDFLNGKITEWKYRSGSEAESTENGRTTYLQFVTHLENISTESDSTNTYLISYSYHEICEEYKETEGMTYLVVYRTPVGEKITYEDYTEVGEGDVPRIKNNRA